MIHKESATPSYHFKTKFRVGNKSLVLFTYISWSFLKSELWVSVSKHSVPKQGKPSPRVRVQFIRVSQILHGYFKSVSLCLVIPLQFMISPKVKRGIDKIKQCIVNVLNVMTLSFLGRFHLGFDTWSEQELFFHKKLVNGYFFTCFGGHIVLLSEVFEILNGNPEYSRATWRAIILIQCYPNMHLSCPENLRFKFILASISSYFKTSFAENQLAQVLLLNPRVLLESLF